MKNLWAPWRMEYIESLSDDTDGDCFLCQYAREPERDSERLVIWRTESCLTVFNRFPYSNGHLLTAPLDHVASLEQIAPSILLEMFAQVRDAQTLLKATTNAHGFNVGMNFGRCAGAGLPGHLHIHTVPRWEGDTNFMAVVGDAKVISQSMTKLYAHMRQAASDLDLPPLQE